MPLQIVHQDITKIKCDAIVDPTDWGYSGSGGADRAIHTTAGAELDRECAGLLPLATGDVAVTGGYKLPCRYVIHTVGPVWKGGAEDEAILLRSCYLNALVKAKALGVESIAFPLISSGTFGFPKDRVMKIALSAISDFLALSDTEPDVYLCVYSREAYELSDKTELEQFLGFGRNLSVTPRKNGSLPRYKLSETKADKAPLPMMANACFEMSFEDDLASWIKQQDDSFAVTLLKLIDKKGMTDVQCYKKANVSKKTFWKINNDPDYRPSKPTVLAFAIALELSLEETQNLLRTVGFSLSHSKVFDMIIEFYILNGNYDIFEINAALYQYDQVCLGC